MKPLSITARMVLSGAVVTGHLWGWAQTPPSAEPKVPYDTVVALDRSEGTHSTVVDATVEAVRQTRLASQVAGAVVAVNVQVGDRVQAGQVLIRLDGHNAQEQSLASQAQLQAAESAWQVATRDLERQKRLFDKQYISQAALERAQTQKDLAQARLSAAQAQHHISTHQNGFYLITAPYGGIVSALDTALGDMAMPGKPLLTVYDPSAMRLRAFVPESWKPWMPANAKPQYTIHNQDVPQTATQFEWVPLVDSATHTIELRIPLPAANGPYTPGQFARIGLPIQRQGLAPQGRIWIPVSATLKRSELVAVYVVKPGGEVVLRQVRLGPTQGDQVEVLSGLDASERIVRQANTVHIKKDH
jgi:membrane fusion protein, multidrug efflux system